MRNLLFISAGLIILASVSFGFAQCSASYTGANKSAAENSAKEWAGSLGMNVKSVTCVAFDTDNDGYVSCSIVESTQTGNVLHAVECVGAYQFNSGCRVPKIRSFL